jgi:hypothetical protein
MIYRARRKEPRIVQAEAPPAGASFLSAPQTGPAASRNGEARGASLPSCNVEQSQAILPRACPGALGGSLRYETPRAGESCAHDDVFCFDGAVQPCCSAADGT